MFDDHINADCPTCGADVIADQHDCGCIFGYCDNCNTCFEEDDNCDNLHPDSTEYFFGDNGPTGHGDICWTDDETIMK